MILIVKLTKNGVVRINFRSSSNNNFILRCNFKCSYCLINYKGMKQRTLNEKDFLDLKFLWDQLSKVDDKIYVRMCFDGEIFINKWLREFAIYISKVPNVKVFEIVTNNSVDPKLYLNYFNPKKTSFSCSFHPESMSIHRFLKSIIILRKSGFNVYVTMVCIPQIIKKIPKIFKLFKEHDVVLKLQAFQTPDFKYMGKKYPQDYNSEERHILKEYFIPKEEYDYFVKRKQTKGLKCYAGVDMFNLFLDGSIRRCYTSPIGKLKQNGTMMNNLRGDFWNSLPEKIREKMNSSIKVKPIRYFSRKIQLYLKYETNVIDLVSGKIKLQKEPYSCHEKNCLCTPHLIGLRQIREKYPLAENFFGIYEL